jgi:hypothetical protein
MEYVRMLQDISTEAQAYLAKISDKEEKQQISSFSSCRVR